MTLEQMQRAVFEVLRQPLTPAERMRPKLPDGRSTRQVVEAIIKPNDRLTSVERLEIYNRVYWFRILSALAEDFPGLAAVIGQKAFDRLLEAYLTECPSRSWTLRDLGKRLEGWLREHLEYVPKVERIAVDMVRLEWADIAAYDDPELVPLKESDLAGLGEGSVLHLQPHLQLLDLDYPVDELLLKLRDESDQTKDTSSNAVMISAHRRRVKRSALPRPHKTYLAVYRLDCDVYFKRLEPGAFALLRALQAGQTLGQAIESSVKWTNRPVEEITGELRHWFKNWASLHWFGKPADQA